MGWFVGDYEIDVEKNARVSYESEVTAHPVEEGADVADNVRPLPLKLSIDGVVSNHPFGDLAARREQFTLVDGEAFFGPANEADAVLRKIRDDREPVTVSCTRGIFPDMILSNYSPRSTTDDALIFSATFTQIRTVENRRAIVRVEERPRQRRRGHREAQAVGSSDGPPAPSEKTRAAVEGVPEDLKP